MKVGAEPVEHVDPPLRVVERAASAAWARRRAAHSSAMSLFVAKWLKQLRRDVPARAAISSNVVTS